MFGNYELTYERGGLSGGNKAIEASVAYLTKPLLFGTLFTNSDYAYNGFHVRVGGKLYFGAQEFSMSGMKRTHPMFGKYIKVELAGGLKYNKSRVATAQDYYTSRYQLLFIGGKQFVADEFCFDIFGGAGYSYKVTTKPVLDGTALTNILPIALEFGFRMGYIARKSRSKY